jgi:Ser/Thr protein kinase RdoA (MazF antagonist)
MSAFGAGEALFGLVHADMRLANLIVDRSGDVHVIDFDDCGTSWYCWDLAASLSFIEHLPQVPEMMDAWVEGYRAEAPLSRAEEAELPTFVMMRRLLLVAWIGSHRETPTAQALGVGYTDDTRGLVEGYLSRFG